MKTIYTILFLLMSVGVFAQDASTRKSKKDKLVSEPSEYDNVIIIVTTESASSAFRQMVQLLSEEGFGMHTLNGNYGHITTTPKQIEQGEITAIVSMRLTNGYYTHITLRGIAESFEPSNPEFKSASRKGEIYYKDSNDSFMRNAWDTLHAIALTFDNAVITYHKK